MTRTSRLQRHGRISIPKEFRDALGLEEGDLLSLKLAEGKLELESASAAPSEGSAWARELYETYAPVREGLKGTDEAEINEAIDRAVAEVRPRSD